MVQNSRLAGLIITAIGLAPLIGHLIWRRFKYPRRKTRNTDPVALAEVYLHYNQPKKAIQVLEKARAANPARADIASKLEEIYRLR